MAALGYLVRELGTGITRRINELGSPPTPRGIVRATLTAVVPTDRKHRVERHLRRLSTAWSSPNRN